MNDSALKSRPASTRSACEFLLGRYGAACKADPANTELNATRDAYAGREIERLKYESAVDKSRTRGKVKALLNCSGDQAITQTMKGAEAAALTLRNGMDRAEKPSAPERRLDMANKLTLPTGNETILIVDDQETVWDFLIEALQKLGYSVLLAENGLDAVESIRTIPDRLISFCWI